MLFFTTMSIMVQKNNMKLTTVGNMLQHIKTRAPRARVKTIINIIPICPVELEECKSYRVPCVSNAVTLIFLIYIKAKRKINQ